MGESKGIHHWLWLLLAVAVFGSVILWGYVDEHHYFSHVKTAQISSDAWPSQQEKSCASWNRKAEPPVLECDEGHSELRQTVPIRFYGDTRRVLEPETLRLHWTCLRKEDVRPAISCRLTDQP